jgi:hypothetical protein
MPDTRYLFAALLALGLAAAAAFRSTGALGAEDALVAAAAQGASVLDPPLRLTTRATGIVVQAMRAIEPTRALFPLVHVTPAILMALVAALSGAIAFRTASAGAAARVGAGIAVGAACLFGADLGAAGRAAGASATILALLAGAAFAWISPKPRAFTGGLLAGLAAIEHPLVFLLLPGFALAALGAAIRAEPGADGRILRRAGIGFAVGLAGIVLEGSDAHGAPLLRLAAPAAWIPSFARLVLTLWEAVGPVGLAFALGGVFALFAGHARHARPFLLIHAVPAFVSIFFVPGDPHVLRALVAWPFLFFMVPGFCAAATRWEALRSGARRAALAAAALAAISSIVLLAMNRAAVDRRSERGIEWARDAFDRMTENGVLFTANPVHWALVADGERPDLDVILVDRPETVRMRRSTLGLFAPEPKDGVLDRTAFVRELIALNLPHRPCFLEPAIYFDAARRNQILGDTWQVHPFGLAFRIAPRGAQPTEPELKAAALLWDEYDLRPGTPPAELRGGLSGNDYYRRSLLQSASLHLDLGSSVDAEREFLFGLTLEKTNPNPALLGLGRIFLERESFEEAVSALAPRVLPDADGAWAVYRLLGLAYLNLADFEGAKRAFSSAIERVPSTFVAERRDLQNLLEAAQQGRRLPGRRTSEFSVG